MTQIGRIVLFLSATTLACLSAAPLRLNREFPIAMYAVNPDNQKELAGLKEMGIDTIHTYGMTGEDNPENRRRTQHFLDAATAAGMRVMVNLRGKKLADLEDGLEQCANFVRSFKEHPAIGFWYLWDEPVIGKDKKAVASFYQMLKKESPEIPVALCVCRNERWWEFAESCDLLMIDYYPIQKKPFPEETRLNNFTGFVKPAVHSGTPVMPVMQCMNWKYFKKAAADADKFRVPNLAELRYCAFASLAMGIRGYSYFGQHYALTDAPRWLHTEFAKSVRELRAFVTQVESIDANRELLPFRKLGCYAGVWPGKKQSFLVLTNSGGKPLQLNAPVSDPAIPRNCQLLPWGLTRKLAANIDDGTLNLELQPWETLVWKISPAPPGK